MIRRMFKSKIHGATVTHANPDSEGRVSIDQELLDLADILPYEAVDVWNVTQGTRLTTYAIAAARGSGVICLNGAAARLNDVGDVVILATFTEMEDAQARTFKPRVVRLGWNNKPRFEQAPEVPGPMTSLVRS